MDEIHRKSVAAAQDPSSIPLRLSPLRCFAPLSPLAGDDTWLKLPNRSCGRNLF